jgi:NAD(P)-dependent dehydrogenase (short-subunit alcohol dehydrogenase family)
MLPALTGRERTVDLRLERKNVLITGGSKGLGLACAKAFRAEGARVAIVSRSRENLDAAKKTLGDAYTIAADLTDAAAAAAMVERVEKEFGPLDILVNSAGAAKRTDADDLTPQAWRAGMDAKYFSYIHVIDPVVKRMAARGRGAIVNIIGNGGKLPAPTHLAGGAANAALMLATAGLAGAYAARACAWSGLNPGLTETGRVAEGMKAERSARASARKRRSSARRRACRSGACRSPRSSPTSCSSQPPSAGCS